MHAVHGLIRAGKLISSQCGVLPMHLPGPPRQSVHATRHTYLKVIGLMAYI